MKYSGPAFPEISGLRMRQGDKETESIRCESGMTLRDYFAAAVLQGMLSCVMDHKQVLDMPEGTRVKARAKLAYEYADIMLEAREVIHGD